MTCKTRVNGSVHEQKPTFAEYLARNSSGYLVQHSYRFLFSGKCQVKETIHSKRCAPAEEKEDKGEKITASRGKRLLVRISPVKEVYTLLNFE